uniref:Uncharacterized protein n=1 Tax=Arundo donax TaxID=35708 RepID=A0A0A8YSJ5_ARUDO
MEHDAGVRARQSGEMANRLLDRRPDSGLSLHLHLNKRACPPHELHDLFPLLLTDTVLCNDA